MYVPYLCIFLRVLTFIRVMTIMHVMTIAVFSFASVVVHCAFMCQVINFSS